MGNNVPKFKAWVKEKYGLDVKDIQFLELKKLLIEYISYKDKDNK